MMLEIQKDMTLISLMAARAHFRFKSENNIRIFELQFFKGLAPE